MPSQNEMLRAVHKANSATTKQRYTPQQLQAAFNKLGANGGGGGGQQQGGLRKRYNTGNIRQSGTNTAGIGGQLAEEQARSGEGVFSGETFNPNLTDRTITGQEGGFGAEREKVQGAVYANLTRGLEDDYNQRKEELQSQLMNSGNPVGTPRYENEMKRFEDDFANRRLNAQNQAIESSGQELANEFGMQEQLRTNEYGEQANTRNQQFSENSALSQLGLPANATLAQISNALAQAGAYKRQNRSSGGRGVYAPQNPNAPIFES